MRYTKTTTALLLALLALALASPATLAGGRTATPVEHPPQSGYHRAAQLPEHVRAGNLDTEPRATYGMITLTRLEVVANTLNPDWETIRFLEVNLAGSPPKFAFAAAPQG